MDRHAVSKLTLRAALAHARWCTERILAVELVALADLTSEILWQREYSVAGVFVRFRAFTLGADISVGGAGAVPISPTFRCVRGETRICGTSQCTFAAIECS